LVWSVQTQFKLRMQVRGSRMHAVVSVGHTEELSAAFVVRRGKLVVEAEMGMDGTTIVKLRSGYT
jgi:hypothetical protein